MFTSGLEHELYEYPPQTRILRSMMVMRANQQEEYSGEKIHNLLQSHFKKTNPFYDNDILPQTHLYTKEVLYCIFLNDITMIVVVFTTKLIEIGHHLLNALKDDTTSDIKDLFMQKTNFENF
ncbi:uncharacterized protein BX663DRAFT_490519 [Cokeromyces recurvatus]|uniref:uncharacterized protein n=1 Tax=Cokeromyces recurvatus TaxID=90255 RepID=UPI00221F9333|nr:uncharacterized protein BX663DRAFT_490519 [Cokeromyces recurvatus]KAI7897897.1 hypothetical protein BX663DRAFT_490519 [Cokeromyces recurvatus]